MEEVRKKREKKTGRWELDKGTKELITEEKDKGEKEKRMGRDKRRGYRNVYMCICVCVSTLNSCCRGKIILGHKNSKYEKDT